MRRASRRSTASSCSCPSPRACPRCSEVAVIRGWADSLALTAACHDVQAAQPAGSEGRPGPRRVRGGRAGPRRGAGRQPHAGHGRQPHGAHRGPVRPRPLCGGHRAGRRAARGCACADRARAADRLGAAGNRQGDGRPVAALDRGARPGARSRGSTRLAEDQETFGRQLRDLLKVLDLSEERSEGEREEGEDDEQDPESGDQNVGGAARKARTARTRPATTSAARARRARPPRPARTPTPTSSSRCRRRGDGRRARAVAAQLQRPR